ncbi:methylenetetrahydrofolate reductase [Porticoccus sp. GXU_MW_L64]
MSYASIHPAWDRDPEHILEGYSLEITAREQQALRDVSPLLKQGAAVSIPYLPTDDADARIGAACTVRSLGFEPMPHLSARRISSVEELQQTVQRCVAEAQVDRVLIIAGDPPKAQGPFEDTMQLLQTGIFEQSGIKVVGIGGHPDGHPEINDDVLWKFLKIKISEIEKRGMTPFIVTQFVFDPESLLRWLCELRERGIEVPVRVGVPGPANIKRLMKFAKICGVGASMSVLKKYGISLGRLMNVAGPEKLVDALAERFSSEHGRVRLHFYPFGGIEETIRWIEKYKNK